MSKMKILKKIYSLVLLFATISQPLIGQIQTKVETPKDALKILGGNGVAFDNINFTGQDYQIGSFYFPNYTGKSFEFESGMVLCNGDVRNAPPPRSGVCGPNGQNKSTETGSGSDDDLNKISIPISGHVTEDRGVLTFDFTAIGNTMEFEYIFASEEYPEFVPGSIYINNSQVHYDAFCLLIKGPGIIPDLNSNGGNLFSDAYKNFATIGSDPISIATVNGTTNSNYYFEDYCSNKFTFDGYTKSFKVQINVECGKKYSVKFAIGDVQDPRYDSYVFFKAKSFTGQGNVGDITMSDGPYCKGSAVNLSIDGSNNYQYEWFNGSTNKQTTFIADNTGVEYWVKITDPSTGCFITKKIKIGEVFANPNTSPYLKGMDDTYQYFRYVNAGKEICFDITGFDYQDNELVTLIPHLNLSGSSINGDASLKKNPKLRFCWTPDVDNIGENLFTVEALDNNPCTQGTSLYTFKIIVVCPNCPIEVLIEDKIITKRPLGSSIVAANKISAGFSVDASQTDGDVILGNNEISTFKAGVEINLEPGFLADYGSKFKAIIEPVCTVKEFCDTCCNNNNNQFRGFFPNVFSPDDDGINDYFQVVDFINPDCAYNISGYELWVFDNADLIVYKDIQGPKQGSSMQCCKFTSIRNLNDNSRLSSINWDGRFNIHRSGRACCGETFFCILTVFNCRGEKTDISFILQAFADPSLPPPLNNEDSDTSFENLTQVLSDYGRINDSVPDLNKIKTNKNISCTIYPNPNNGLVNIWVNNWPNNIEYGIVFVYDSYGRIIKEEKITRNLTIFDMSNFENSIYTMKIVIGDTTFIKQTIIQK